MLTTGADDVVEDMMDIPECRLMIMKMCIACADISHSSKPWALHEQWSKRILQEFFLQGEAEAAKGMPISSLCDRKAADVFKSQIGFIDFLAMPQFEAWCEFLSSQTVSDDMLGNIKINREKWVDMQDQKADQTPYKDSRQLRSTFFEM